MRLYTVTVFTDKLSSTEDPMILFPIKDKKSVRDSLRKELFNKLFAGVATTWDEISRDSDFIEMRKKVDQTFEKLFAQAYKLYIRGDW
jgi:hypothetical protein